MLAAPQALTEYVSLTASKIGATAGAGIRQAIHYGSEHFVAVIAVMVAMVFLFMVLSGSRR